MARARRWQALVVVALALPACLNPDDIFPVEGTVVSVDPLEGQVVMLLRQPRLAYACDGTGLVPFKETSVDAGGGYGFEVFRAQAMSLSAAAGGSFCFRVEADFPSGSSAWSDLAVYGQTLVGPLRDWRAAPRVVEGVLRFEPPVPWPDEAGLDGGAVPQLDDQVLLLSGDGGVVWKAGDRFAPQDLSRTATRVELRVDAPRLEDFAGTLSLRAALGEPLAVPPGLSNVGGWGLTRLVAGQTLPFAGVRVPLSRGLPCPEVATPCPLTDGDLTVVDAGSPTEVTLALGAPAPLSTLVLRGVYSGALEVGVLLGQADGGALPALAFRLQPSASDESAGQGPLVEYLEDGGFLVVEQGPALGLYAVLGLDAGVPVTRVTLQFPGGLQRIAEVSLFE